MSVASMLNSCTLVMKISRQQQHSEVNAPKFSNEPFQHFGGSSGRQMRAQFDQKSIERRVEFIDLALVERRSIEISERVTEETGFKVLERCIELFKLVEATDS